MADDDVVERFRAYLREHDLPITSPRLVIADLMLHASGHLSAEDVASQLREKGSKVGLATVYRTIDLLVDSGLVMERDFSEGFRRFETARDVPQHYHLTCLECGHVEEFQDERIVKITANVAAAHGFKHARHRLVVHGTCAACQRAATPNARSSS